MTMKVALKSKSTGLVGMYPKKHAALSDDLVPVDEDGNVCLPCMGVVVEETPNNESAGEKGQNSQSKDKK